MMEFKDEELSVVAQSTLKFAKEEAEREFEKVRQKYIKKRKSNAVHLTTSVEDYENTLTELRLKHLKEDLNAYFDINPKLYAYVCAINAKEELNFIHEHNKIHRHDVGRETIMKEIVTRRFDSVKVDNQLEKTKYEKEKYEKEEERDYQHRLDIEKVAKELLQQANKEDLLVESYATIYSNLVQEFEKICDENKAEMDSLFEKVDLLVKENFKKIAFTAEKTKITEIAKDRDQKARDLLAIHRQDIDNNVDYKVLKVQLREKLPVEEKLKKVEEQKEVYKKQIQDLETQINQLNEEIQTIEKAIDEKRKENQKEFVERVDFSELNNVTTEEAEVLHKINSCFVKESEEIFDALIEIINEYGKKNFVPFDIYKKEHIQNYDQQIQTINETLKTFIQPIDEKKKEKEIIASFATQLNEVKKGYQDALHALQLEEKEKLSAENENTSIKEEYSLKYQELKKQYAEKVDDLTKQKENALLELTDYFYKEKAVLAKKQYLQDKKDIKQARLERKKTYKEKKKEARQKLKRAESNFAKIEIRETLQVYKKEIKEGDKAKYKKAKRDYKNALKQIKKEKEIAILSLSQPKTVVLQKIYENDLHAAEKRNEIEEKEFYKDLNKQLKLNRYRKNMTKARRENILGYIFLSVWAIGFVILTLYPLIYTIFLSFSEIGYNMGYDPLFYENGKLFPNWIGFDNYSSLIFSNTSFLYEKLPTFFMSMAFFLPIVVFIAFVLAMLLNTKIVGRTFFRVIYFLPVIIISGPLLSMLNGNGGDQSTIILSIDGTFIATVLEAISEQAVEYADFIFQNFIIILWMTGVPIVLFISGLQKIDRSLYEAAEIDGANKWQALWTVTFPLIKSVILIACLFTIVQIATIDITWINPIKSSGDSANPGIVELMSSGSNYGLAAAMAWVQTLIVLIFVGIVFLLFREKEFVEKQKSYEEVERLKAKRVQRKAKLNAFFHVDAIKRGWARATAPIVKLHHTRQLKAKKRQEEKGE